MTILPQNIWEEGLKMSELLKGEKILDKRSPHPLSFWPYYLFFLYYIIVNSLILFALDDIVAWVEGSLISVIGDIGTTIVLLVLWWAIIIIPAIIFAILKISFRWMIFYFLLAVIGTYAIARLGATIEQLLYVTVGISVVGILLTDVYRRSHEYILTNFRIITKLGFFGHKVRDIFYSKISDVFLEQGFLGTIFDYGTIIPVTPSGIGTGEDSAKVAIGVGGAQKVGPTEVGVGIGIEGEKSVKVARGRSSFVLYGVPNPSQVRKLILENMAKKEAAPYLERTVELLEELVEKEEEEEEEKSKKK